MRALEPASSGDGLRISSQGDDEETAIDPAPARGLLQATMSDFVGVNRSEDGLSRAGAVLDELCDLLDATPASPADLEVQNMVTLATLTAHAARYRTESRGAHWRDDFPARYDAHLRVHTVWRRGARPRLDAVRSLPMLPAQDVS